MAKEKIIDLVGVLIFYLLIILGVIMINNSLGRVNDYQDRIQASEHSDAF